MSLHNPKMKDEIFLSKKSAWLYYVAKLSQNQIAKKLGLSKMRIHRLIALAEKNGYVKTFVEGAFDEITKYESVLKKKYNIKICEVIPNDDQNNNPLEMLGAAGARFIMSQIHENNINEFGIGTGATMSSVAKWLPKINKKVDFISLHGSLTSNNSIQTENSINQIAHKTEGDCYGIAIPLMLESIEKKKNIENFKFVKEIIEKGNYAKIKLLGVGGLNESSQIVKSKIISKKSITKLKEIGAVGEVSGNFFNIEGKLITNKETKKIFGSNIAFLKNSKTVLIAGGKNKIIEIKSVLKSGIFSGLITDEKTAQNL